MGNGERELEGGVTQDLGAPLLNQVLIIPGDPLPCVAQSKYHSGFR